MTPRGPDSAALRIDLHHPPETRLERGIRGAKEWLERHQAGDGFWVGLLESNSCIEAEWILALHFLGVDDPKHESVVRGILQAQRPDGSWEVYYDAPQGDINATVECYAALRAAGLDPECESLRRARQWIFDHGGLGRLRVFSRFWLALIGEWPWESTPTLPPELIFLPPWCPFNVYEFSSWARATLVPLMILSARRPVRPLPPERRLDELFPEGRAAADYRLPHGRDGVLGALFRWGDRLLNRYVGFPWKPGRETAIRLCLEWILRRQDADGGWGGIQPPLIYSLMAIHAEGYAVDHPAVARGLSAFDPPCAYQKNGETYLQCSSSPVWDTLLSVLALLESGEDPRHSRAIHRALRWILDRQVNAPGDWKIRARDTRPGGWAFEWHNNFYPDVDDTAVALIVLQRTRTAFAEMTAVDEAMARAEEWLRGLQCDNGGWASFDRNNWSRWVTRIPFCDFGEVLDPPSVDVTAHVVEAFATLGYGPEDPAVARALDYIRREQEPEGSWFGRWGVNHIYGTAAVLPALHAVGEDMSADYVRRAAEWIIDHQNEDGGWGETCASYMDDSLRGVGTSAPSQTAWALMALLAVDRDSYAEAIDRGLEFLLDRQKGGTWEEPQYTGTGFPGYGVGERTDLRRARETLIQGRELSRGFMINYNMYRHYFPLMAMGRARNRTAPASRAAVSPKGPPDSTPGRETSDIGTPSLR